MQHTKDCSIQIRENMFGQKSCSIFFFLSSHQPTATKETDEKERKNTRTSCVHFFFFWYSQAKRKERSKRRKRKNSKANAGKGKMQQEVIAEVNDLIRDIVAAVKKGAAFLSEVIRRPLFLSFFPFFPCSPCFPFG